MFAQRATSVVQELILLLPLLHVLWDITAKKVQWKLFYVKEVSSKIPHNKQVANLVASTPTVLSIVRPPRPQLRK